MGNLICRLTGSELCQILAWAGRMSRLHMGVKCGDWKAVWDTNWNPSIRLEHTGFGFLQASSY